MSRTNEELKQSLESGNAHLECGLCMAVFWVDGSDRNAKGEPRLYRMGTTRMDDCKACSELASVCNMKNEMNVRMDPHD